MEPQFQKINEFLLKEHSCLEPNDYCYFIGDYAARQGFNHSEMNHVIHNFKKPVERKDLPEWRHKEQATVKIAHWIISLPTFNKLKKATWIPIPPSKAKNDPQHDDRLWRVLLKMKEMEKDLDIRELLLIKVSREAAHNPGITRPKTQDHFNNLMINQAQQNPSPQAIVLFDDIITSGANFKAAQKMIKHEFPEVPTVGLFVARNVQIE